MKNLSSITSLVFLIIGMFSLTIFVSSCSRNDDEDPLNEDCISDGNCNTDCTNDPDCTPTLGTGTDTLICNNISSDMTLVDDPNATIDYFVDCILTIKAEVNIQPGVVIAFGADAGIIVGTDGHLNAVGTSSNKITFRGKEPSKGYWRGVQFESNTINNELTHVVIQDAGLEDIAWYSYALTSLMIYDGQISLNNLTIQNGAGHGITIYKEATVREYNDVTITTHNKEPLFISSQKVSDLDGVNSDYTGNTENNILVYPDAINGEAIWTANNIPYKLMSDDVLDVIEEWTVEAGVEIVVEADGGIGVTGEGSMALNGTESAPIIIRGEEAAKGYWRGVHVGTNSIKNELNYAQISDAGSEYVYWYSYILTTLLAHEGALKINNSTFSNGAGYGITMYNDATVSEFSNNRITTHDEEAMYIHSNRIGNLDGLGSDYSGNDKDFILVDGVSIDDDFTWTKTNVPYLIDGDVIDINAGVEIEAGTQIVFKENTGLGVIGDGSLDVQGTSSDKVEMRGQNDIADFWLGILYDTNSSNNRMTHVDIDGAGAGYVYWWGYADANINVTEGSLVVEDCQISRSGGWGIYIHDGATCDMDNNTFAGNTSGDVGP